MRLPEVAKWMSKAKISHKCLGLTAEEALSVLSARDAARITGFLRGSGAFFTSIARLCLYICTKEGLATADPNTLLAALG